MILLIDNTDSFTYNLSQRLQAQTSLPVSVVRHHDITFNDILQQPLTHVVLSPGPGHPQNPQDFGVCRDVVLGAERLNVPVLGVCLGFQGMVHHLGGTLCHAPHVKHGKTSDIIRVDAKEGGGTLFSGIEMPMTVMRYHSWQVEALPDCFTPLAYSDDDAVLMAAAHNTLPLWGVQFHPESVGTPQGDRLLENFLSLSSFRDNRGPQHHNALFPATTS